MSNKLNTSKLSIIPIPTLLVIGGDTTNDGPIVNDVFATQPGGKILNTLRCIH